MREYAVDELARHLRGALGMIVEGRDCRKDCGACLGGELHVAQMDAVEWSLADAQDEGAALLEADIGGPMDEIRGQAVGDSGEGSHGAGKHDHGAGGIASAGDAGTDVGIRMLAELCAGSAKKFFSEAGASAKAKLFCEDTQRAFGRDEVNAGDALVGGQGTQHLDGIDAAAGSGDGEGQVARGWNGFRHWNDYRLGANQTLRRRVFI